MRHLPRLYLSLLIGFAVTTMSVGTAVAAGKGGGPNPADAAKIAGIEQLVADYVQFVDWGPQSDVPPNNGVLDTEAIGNLFTENGNFTVYFWNSGNPVPLSWHPASGSSYDRCDNVGPAAVARFFGGPGSLPRGPIAGHHVITNLQITVNPDGVTGIVRGTQTITLGIPNADNTGGTVIVPLSGRYYGLVRLTSNGWKFDWWQPTEDQPSFIPGCLANNQNP